MKEILKKTCRKAVRGKQIKREKRGRSEIFPYQQRDFCIWGQLEVSLDFDPFVIDTAQPIYAMQF